MRTLGQADARTITAAVLRVSNACLRLADAAFGGVAGAGSPAAAAIASKYNKLPSWRGDNIITGLHRDAYYGVLAGVENAHAFVVLARNSRDFSVALSTTTRATIEALARVGWLLGAGTSAELVTRGSNLAIADLAYAERLKTDVVMKLPDGSSQTRNIVEYRRDIDEYLLDHQLADHEPDKTELAVHLLQQSDPTLARAIYSGLSAAAHGESYAIQNFAPPEERARDIAAAALRLEMTDDMLIEYPWLLVASLDHIGNQIGAYFAPHRKHLESWSSSRDAALLTLKEYGQLRKDDAG